MMRHYFLTSKRMGFSHWLADDASLADMLWGNSDVARFICAGGSLTQRQIADRPVLEMDNQRQFGVQYWPVFLLDNQQFTGCCGLRPYQLQPLVYEIGVHLLPDYWKQGLAAEALQAVMDYAQRDRGATGLFARASSAKRGVPQVVDTPGGLPLWERNFTAYWIDASLLPFLLWGIGPLKQRCCLLPVSILPIKKGYL